jgi:hypothetical protein
LRQALVTSVGAVDLVEPERQAPDLNASMQVSVVIERHAPDRDRSGHLAGRNERLAQNVGARRATPHRATPRLGS